MPDIGKLEKAVFVAFYSGRITASELVEAILTSLTEQGFVVVPETPTEAMAEAGAANLFGAVFEDWNDDARAIWSAMLAAHKGTAHEAR